MREFFGVLSDHPLTALFVAVVIIVGWATALDGIANIVRSFGTWRER